MPRVKKTVRKNQTKNKNKNKVVVRNVININSNNKRKGISKPSFAQLSQQPRSQGSTVVSHFVQQPTSAYNPQVESGLVKSLEIARDLITKAQEREANLIRENQSRLTASVSGPPAETPLQEASVGRRLTFDVGTPNSPIVEKGGGGYSRSFRDNFTTPLQRMLGGRRPEPTGSPQANSLNPFASESLAREHERKVLQSQEQALRRNVKWLFENDKESLWAIHKDITRNYPAPAIKDYNKLSDTILESPFRDVLLVNLDRAYYEKTGGGKMSPKASSGGGRAKSK